MDIFNQKPKTKNELLEMNTISLAFVGDSVHTLFIRNYISKNTKLLVNKQHLLAIKYCRAKFQAQVLDNLLLTEEEQEIVKRAKNSKTHNAPKSSNIEEYKKATALEALIGWLWLLGEYKRLNEILTKCLGEL